MKTCPNCRAIHPDDYAGTCQDCGRGLGDVKAGSAQDPETMLARWTRQDAGLTKVARGSTPHDEGAYRKAYELLVPKEGAFTED